MHKEKHTSANQIGLLESKLDFLETEFTNLDTLLREIGFVEGITTLKEAAKELLADVEKPL